ncbi:hypothetical protein BGX31_002057 [Mortierella sp. GBA43]|nr:hypothetical protein BGX31_002057 [Mortierella sp. GBA43]
MSGEFAGNAGQRQLEDLALQGCALITDDAIEELAYHCQRLTRIDLGRCFRLGDRSLLALLRNSGRMAVTDANARERTRSAKLTKLSITGCNGVTLTGLLAIEKYLSTSLSSGNRDDAIDLDDRELDTESSLVSLEFSCPPLKKGTNKTQNGHFLFPSTSTTGARANLSQASRFFRTLPRTLEDIAIHDAVTLSHNDVICLVDRIGSNLKTLRLDNANAIGSDTFSHILTMCPNLTVLCIPRATRLDDTGVTQLKNAKCAQSLVELDLSACHLLTDACLTSLALNDPSDQGSREPSPVMQRSLKGKSVCGQEQAGRFPNLRRLDLSYNDKLTLSGIIPLVMSLKNLCALDVSFCGEGVTRPWSMLLESLRPILNPSAVDSPQPSSEQGNTLNGNSSLQAGGASFPEESHGEGSSSQSAASMQEEEYQSTASAATSAHGIQQLTSGVNNMIISGRRGLGGYVGPWLTRLTGYQSQNDGSRQYPGQGMPHDLQNGQTQGSTSSTSSPSNPRIVDSSTHHVNGSRDQCSNSHRRGSGCCSASSSPTYPTPHTMLVDRLDVLEYAPRRAGIPARFLHDSWFTAQHQSQLQHLYYFQQRRQREVQEQVAAAAMGGGGPNNGQVNFLELLQGITGPDVPHLPRELTSHPVMIRAGIPQPQHPTVVNVDVMEPNNNSNWVIVSLRRRHHRQHHNHRQGMGVMGHCEISAWGLARLKEEWAMT